MATGWPLVGRDIEMEVGVAALAEQRGLVVGGVAGVGKSRFANELAERVASSSGAAVLRISGSPVLADVPAGALAPVLASSGAGLGRRADEWAPSDAPEDLLLPWIHQVIAGHRSEHGLLLVVDDAHQLDELSASAVLQLVRSETVQLIATVRSGEPSPHDVIALWKEDLCARLELLGLAEREIAELAGAVLGAPLDDDSAHRLAAASLGIPLAARELVLDGLDTGRFRTVHGLVHWDPAGSVGVRLHDLVASWLGALEREPARLLLMVAVGEPVPYELLQVAERKALEELLARGALVVDDDRGVRLGHPLYGEVARAQASVLELDETRADLAERLRPTLGPDDPDLLRCGRWLVAAGSGISSADLPLLVDGAELAVRLGDVEGALALAEAAVAAGSIAAIGIRADALVRLGRVDEALAALDELRHADATPEMIRRAAQVEIVAHLGYRGDRAGAEAAADRAIARLTRPADHAFVRGVLATNLSLAGHVAEAGEIATQVLATDDPAARLRALPGATAALVAAGRIEEAIARGRGGLDESLACLETVPDGLRWSASALAWALLVGGELAQLRELTDLMAGTARADAEVAAFRYLITGRVALFEGRPTAALPALGSALVWHQDRGQLQRVRWLLALLAEAEAGVGMLEESATSEAAARALPPTGHLADLDAARAMAWAAATRDSVGGVELLRDAVAQAADRGALPFELLAGFDLFRITTGKAVRRRLVELTGAVSGRASATIRAIVTAETGDELDQAARLAAEHGLALWSAEVSQRAAAAHRARGRGRAASSAARDAVDRWESCGRPRSPAFVDPGAPAALTSREREVAELAAAGEPSRAIADRLGVSTRTVDNLLGRVYLKLGIRGRSELGDALRSGA